MTVKDLERRFDHGYWANRKLMGMVAQLPPEQFTKTVDGAHGSIRNTLVHMLSAEWGWLGRCGGPERGPALQPADYPTPAAIEAAWAKVETSLRDFLAQLREEDLHRSIEFALGGSTPRRLPLGQLLEHAANHAAHHRGQVSLLLRLLGRSPDNFDLLFYDLEKQGPE